GSQTESQSYQKLQITILRSILLRKSSIAVQASINVKLNRKPTCYPPCKKKDQLRKNKKRSQQPKTPTTKAQPFKKKKTIDLASPSGKDTSANLAPLPDESTSPDKPVPHESGDSKGSRSKNYDDEEDVHICKSWLHVSQDPLNSTNQAGDTFWKRVGKLRKYEG
ncbi:hypothetical protein PSHT_16116, partial [Puccinia striiformis]